MNRHLINNNYALRGWCDLFYRAMTRRLFAAADCYTAKRDARKHRTPRDAPARSPPFGTRNVRRTISGTPAHRRRYLAILCAYALCSLAFFGRAFSHKALASRQRQRPFTFTGERTLHSGSTSLLCLAAEQRYHQCIVPYRTGSSTSSISIRAAVTPGLPLSRVFAAWTYNLRGRAPPYRAQATIFNGVLPTEPPQR